MAKKNLIFLNTHPIQYFAPLYKSIEKDGRFNLEVWYCSEHGLQGEIDKQFGTSVKWDIPLLEGYKFKFLKNNSRKPGLYTGFLGLLNLEVIKLLWNAPKSLVVIHGWNFATNLITLLVAKIFGHRTALRGEAPITLEALRSKADLKKRHVLLKILFFWTDFFFYIGENNRKFYQYYGVKENRLAFTPYSVDNERFQTNFKLLKPDRDKYRSQKGLKSDIIYALFSGKYIEKKRPMDLLKAIHILQSEGVKVGAIFMGEGEKRAEMETYIKLHSIQDILLTGFINQSEISEYYTMADIFVMCSNAGETWGLSTNEAMNFELPIVLYDSVGCSADLVKNALNGFLVQESDINALAESLKKLALEDERRKEMGKNAQETIAGYSYEKIIISLNKVA